MKPATSWPKSALTICKGTERQLCLCRPKDGKTQFVRLAEDGSEYVFLTSPLSLPVEYAISMFAKLANTEITPAEFRVPLFGLQGRRPRREGDKPFSMPAGAEVMRKEVEKYAGRYISKVDLLVEQRSILSSGGAIHLTNGPDTLWISYNPESDTIDFDRVEFSVELLLAAVPHVLRDQLACDVDPRYYLPWMPATIPNLWEGGPVPKSKRARNRTEQKATTAASSVEVAEAVAITNNDSELLLGLLDAAAPHVDTATASNANVAGLLGILRATLAPLREAMLASGINPRKPGIDSIDEIPAHLKEPFQKHMDSLLEAGLNAVKEREASVVADREALKQETDNLLNELAERDATLKSRELELSQQQAKLKGLSEQLSRREESLKRGIEACEAQLLAKALDLLTSADTGKRLRHADRQLLEEAKYVVSHARKRGSRANSPTRH